MGQADINVEQDREALAQAHAKGPISVLGTYIRLSGPGWLQSAITLGGGSLAGALFLGILGGTSMLWLQLMAIIMGVVMLSVYPEAQFALRAIRSGANAYLNKGCSPQELTQALQMACAGQVYLTPATANLMANDLRKPADRPPHERLSNREMQVLRLMAQGETVQHIAQALCLSGNTVSTYRARVFEKLELKNLVDLVNYTKLHGL